MLVGSLSEPIKSAFQWQARLRRAERAIGFDFVNLHIGWTAVKNELVSAENFWAGMVLPGFDHYWSKERDLFSDNIDLHLVMIRCLRVQRLLEGVRSEKISKEFAGEQLEQALEESLADSKKPPSLIKRLMRSFRF